MTKLINKDKSAKGLYKQIKIDLVSRVYQPGERIVIDQLAERLRVSSTPVREILNRLAAEKLVSIVPQMGFFMPFLTEEILRPTEPIKKLLIEIDLSGSTSIFSSKEEILLKIFRSKLLDNIIIAKIESQSTVQ